MANRRLALETSAHTSSAKSSPTVKPDVDDVGEDRTFAGSVTAPPRCPVDILAPSRPSLDSPHAAPPLSPSPSRLLPAQSFYLLSPNVLE